MTQHVVMELVRIPPTRVGPNLSPRHRKQREMATWSFFIAIWNVIIVRGVGWRGETSRGAAMWGGRSGMNQRVRVNFIFNEFGNGNKNIVYFHSQRWIQLPRLRELILCYNSICMNNSSCISLMRSDSPLPVTSPDLLLSGSFINLTALHPHVVSLHKFYPETQDGNTMVTRLYPWVCDAALNIFKHCVYVFFARIQNILSIFNITTTVVFPHFMSNIKVWCFLMLRGGNWNWNHFRRAHNPLSCLWCFLVCLFVLWCR